MPLAVFAPRRGHGPGYECAALVVIGMYKHAFAAHEGVSKTAGEPGTSVRVEMLNLDHSFAPAAKIFNDAKPGFGVGFNDEAPTAHPRSELVCGGCGGAIV